LFADGGGQLPIGTGKHVVSEEAIP